MNKRIHGWLTGAALGTAVLAAPAMAQGGGGENAGGAVAAAMLLPVIAGFLQLLLAAIWPQAIDRLAGAWRVRPEATVGWGVLGSLLLALVVGLLAVVGQQPGQALAGLLAMPVIIVAYACIGGISSLVGAWCLRRDGKPDQPTFLKVMIGSLVITMLAWVPILGTLMWIGLSVFALGAFIRATVGLPSVRTEHAPTAPPPPPSAGDRAAAAPDMAAAEEGQAGEVATS
jgi:hypothetical protein